MIEVKVEAKASAVFTVVLDVDDISEEAMSLFDSDMLLEEAIEDQCKTGNYAIDRVKVLDMKDVK